MNKKVIILAVAAALILILAFLLSRNSNSDTLQVGDSQVQSGELAQEQETQDVPTTEEGGQDTSGAETTSGFDFEQASLDLQAEAEAEEERRLREEEQQRLEIEELSNI